MFDRFTDGARKCMMLAREQANIMGHDFLGTEHLLIALIKEGAGCASKVLRLSGLDLPTLLRVVESKVPSQSDTMIQGELPLTPYASKVIEHALQEAKLMNSGYVASEHLLLGLFDEKRGVAYQILSEMGLTKEKAKEEIMRSLEGGGPPKPSEETSPEEAKRKKDSKTPALDTFGNDLTERASKKELDPMIGRLVEVRRLMRTLVRRRKNNPVLLGEPGVGKTAIVEGLAQMIVAKDVPDLLASKRIVELDLALVVAGTKYRGQFEERIKAILDETSKNKDIILFIDEIHIMVGAGNAEGAMDASNMLKPALSRGQVQVIGATTLSEYRKHIEKDGALERRFQPIIIEEPTTNESVEILKGLKHHYSGHHGVGISESAIVDAVRLTERYITDRRLPDKAIDVIDEAGAMMRLERHDCPDGIRETEKLALKLERDKEQAVAETKFEEAAKLRDKCEELRKKISEAKTAFLTRQLEDLPTISPEQIREVISSMTGIPISEMTTTDAKKLVSMEEEMHKSIVGQEEAVNRVCKAIRRARAGFKDPNRPVCSMLFLGPTGVGKTLLAKTVAKFLFGAKGNFFQLDMSEYMEQHAVSKLIGAPPGYIGHDEGGQLTEKVRRHPYCVVLFDEIEKAHDDVFNSLLQVMEEGRLTDGLGRTVDFKNAIVFMTSNAGACSAKEYSGLGFGKKDEADKNNVRSRIRQEVEKTFRPEFINRLDDLVFFDSLSEKELRGIVDLEISKLMDRLQEKDLSLDVKEEAKTLMMEKGYKKEYGARPLRRAVEDYLEDPLSDRLLSGELKPDVGDIISVSRNGEELSFTVSHDQNKTRRKRKAT